jgi:murein L,D-transpeptidase YafK
MGKFFVCMAIISLIFLSLLFYTRHEPPSQRPFTTINYILVEKEKRQMSVFFNGQLLKTYRIALGFSPKGHKEKEGDGKTPEGNYHISKKNAISRFFLSLKISYPSPQDEANAAKNGYSVGGDVMIHGLPNGFSWLGSLHTFKDWTRGCIAVRNEEIQEIYSAISEDTRIEIRP